MYLLTFLSEVCLSFQAQAASAGKRTIFDLDRARWYHGDGVLCTFLPSFQALRIGSKKGN